MMLRSHPMLGVCLLAAIVTSMVTAQGPAYRERWGYLHLENRRAELFEELAPRSTEDVAKVAELLSVPHQSGVPFTPVANALAFLRGVEADEAFLLRSALGIYVLPEVVDVDSSVASCRAANFSVFLPFTMSVPGEMAFAFTAHNATGDLVWSQTVTEKTGFKDVRMGQAKARFLGEGLADGVYEVAMRTLLDGEPPRKHDPVLRWTFHVQRGYQSRAEAAMTKARQMRADLDPLPKALLDGLALQVSRAYGGEAFALKSDAVRDLQLLEAGVENCAKGLPTMSGFTGKVATALPAGDIVQPCVLRMPKDTDAHPMVVFVSGCPAYDIGSHRPSAPSTREAGWLLREVGDFGAAEEWHVVCFDSPGGGRPFANALLSSLKALPTVLATGPQKPLLVCDREAAAVVAMRLQQFRPYISGVVLCGGGAMPKGVIDQLGDLPVCMVALADYPGSRAVARMISFVDTLGASGKPKPDIALLHDRQEAWLFGVARSRSELAAFAAKVFAGR